MAVAAGTRFGVYEITGLIGVGGMGEVYKARDTRLDRIVAIKVLPEHIARDPNLRHRFQREAKALAALSHPHICNIHDVGSQDGIDFLVMEYLQGETLEQRLKQGASLSLDQSLQIGIQIAGALSTAHRAGIVHRDLKPGNIMLTKSGAKLLDFGLAKTAAPAVAASLSTSSTTPPNLTVQGTILGTFEYMAPEQIEGKDADGRSDIFAFGVVLHEMVTGRKAFEGATHAALMAAILNSPAPSMSALNSRVSAFLDHVAQRCLMKDPDDRWQSIRDVAIELESAADLFAVSRSKSEKRWHAREWLGWATAGAILVGALVLMRTGLPSDEQQTPVTRLSVLPPERTTFLGGYSAPHLALSPDGRRLAFVPTPIGGRALLWIRALDSVTSTPIAGTDGATFPFWSPDGRRLAFFADGKLKTIDPQGGPAHVVCDAPDSRGGAWGADGTIVFTPQLVGPLYRVSANGGEPVAVTKLEPSRQEVSHRLPNFLPDGRHFTFLVQSGTPATSNVRVGSLDSDETHALGIVGSEAIYAQGFLVFRRDESLMVQPFDLSTRQLAEDPVSLGDQVALRNTVYGDGVFSVAENGTLAYWHGGTLLTDITWFNRNGEPLGQLPGGPSHFSLALSPDEQTVVVEAIDDVNQVGNLWMIDVVSGIRSRITSGSANWGPVWSPDGRRIAFGSLRNGPSSLYERPVMGAGAERLLLGDADYFIGATDWSSDGRSILIQDLTRFKLGILPLEGEPTLKPLLQSSFDEGDGRWSPDGRWLAYTSNESGVWDVYVQPFPALDRKWRISPDGGSQPKWRADGKELYYVGPDQRLMAVPVTADSGFRAGVPTALFPLRMVPFPPTQPRQQYAVAANGDRFLVNTFVEPLVPPPVTIVLNWTAALKK